MPIDIERVKGFFTMYLFFMIVGASLFSIFIDAKALKDKKLNKEAKVCKVLGYMYLIGGVTLFVVVKYVV